MKKSPIIKLIKPNVGQTEIEAVLSVLQSGMLVAGPKVQEFEQLLAEYLDIPFAVMVSSGTAALHLSLMAMDIGPGDEVLVSAFTFPATANAVEMVGATPVFVDCQAGSVNLDIDLAKKKIGPKTKAILPVHAFGLPADMDQLTYIARKNNLAVIEDAACALGSKFNGGWCGTFGKAGIFSFHPRKLLTTGEGGAVVTSDADIAKRIMGLRNHGLVDGTYQTVGLNYRMTDFQAAMGSTQLLDYDQSIVQRRTLAERYWRQLESIAWVQPILPVDRVEWNVQTLLVCLDECVNREDLIAHLKTYGIESTIGTYCVPMIPYYHKKYGYVESDFPIASSYYLKLLSLPLYNDMSDEDIDKVFFALNRFLSF